MSFALLSADIAPAMNRVQTRQGPTDITRDNHMTSARFLVSYECV
jgi:hypothetical protein